MNYKKAVYFCQALALAAACVPGIAGAQDTVNPGEPIIQVSTKQVNVQLLPLQDAVDELLKDPQASVPLYDAVKEIYLRQNRRDKAIGLLGTYYRNKGTDSGLLQGLAYLLEQEGAEQQAIEVHERVVRLDSERGMGSKSALAHLYRRQGQSSKAIPLLEKDARDAEDNTELQRELARAYLDAGELENAEATAKKIMKKQPQARDYQKLAEIYVKRDKFDLAEQTMQEGIKKLPQEAYILGMTLHTMYADRGEKIKAVAVLNDILAKVTDQGLRENVRNLIKTMDESFKPSPPPEP